MEKHIVKVLKTEQVTHNVKRFTLERPENYPFISGQATDVSINRPGLEEEIRPFTFTCLDSDDHLEFTIKTYIDHDGVTNKLRDVNAGDELIVHEVFGVINFKGMGVFIAGGAGLTPFISILRQLRADNQLTGNTLLFFNKTDEDIIIKDELDVMLGDRHIDIITSKGQRIDKELLKQYIGNEQAYYYICGPDQFVADIKKMLLELEITENHIVIEE